MRTLLFLVHGMGMRSAVPAGGQTADDAMRSWYRDIVSTLRSLPGRYGLNLAFDMDDRPGRDVAGAGPDTTNTSPLARRLTVVPVTYSDSLGAALTRLTSIDRDLGAALAASGTALDQEVATFLAGKDATDAGFVWTHVVDVLLMRLDVQSRAQVRLSIAKQLVDAQKDYTTRDGDQPRIAVIAHSLGTFATADTLQAMVANAAAEGLPSFLPGVLVVDLFLTLANVSRLLSRSVNDPYGWVVRPRTVGAPGTAQGVVRTFVNAQHEEDPFLWAWPFHAPSWDRVFDYAHCQLTALRQVNAHGFNHYLSDPRVHCTLLNLLAIGGKQIVKSARDAAVAEYEQDIAGAPCAQAITRLKGRLRALHNAKPREDTLLQWVRSLQALWTEIETAKAECPQEFKA